MDKRFFKELITIQNIENEIASHNRNIESHKGRITTLENKRAQKENLHSEKSELFQKTKELLGAEEKMLFDIEKKLETSKRNLNNATTEQQLNAINKEIDILTPKSEEHESLALEFMEKMEFLQDELDELTTFLEGSKETLKEISAEVSNDIQTEQESIDRREEVILEILDKLTGQDKDIFLLVDKKFKYNSPLAFIDDSGHCKMCGENVPPNTRSIVEKGASMEMCSGCGRILAPTS